MHGFDLKLGNYMLYNNFLFYFKVLSQPALVLTGVNYSTFQ